MVIQVARIPEEKIEEIRTKTDIVDLIGEYIQLTKKGRNWFGLCPFHGESTPSFSVSEEKQLFHCFGCGASGNAITFVMDLENRTFTETVVELAERSSVELDIGLNHYVEDSKRQEFKQMNEAHTLATNFYNHILLNTVEGEEALEYLEARGFTRESIEKYGIGWALDDFNALTSLLQRKSFNMEEMEEAGLIIKRDDGTGYFDRFRGRIMFPLWDDHGNVIAFSGRSISNEKETAKYLNSPETPIFEKSKVLYNLHHARLNIRKTGKVILFEGFMDAIAADQVNVSNVVAIMGTSLSEAHLVKLKRIAKQLIICCDGDDAGWEAAKRFAKLAIANGMDPQVALLPNDMDPDDYIQQYGGQAFQDQVIGNPHSYMSFVMAYAKRSKNLRYENDVLQFIHEVLEELALRPSPLERDLFIRQLAEQTNVSTEAITQQFMKVAGNRARQAKDNSTLPAIEQAAPRPLPQKKSKSGVERAEQILLHHLLNDGALFDRFKEERREVFCHEDYKTIFVRLAGFYEEYQTPDFHRFAESIEDRALRAIVLEAAMLDTSPDYAEQEIEDCIRFLEQSRIKIKVDELEHEIIEAARINDSERAKELLAEMIQLKQSSALL